MKILKLTLGVVFGVVALSVSSDSEAKGSNYDSDFECGMFKISKYLEKEIKGCAIRIDGELRMLSNPSFAIYERKKLLDSLEQAMAENNALTEKYLRTKSPAWKDLMTEEMKANIIKFRDAWKLIVIESIYGEKVLDAYEKYQAAALANKDKMYAHFYSLSTNEPFKTRVRKVQQNEKNYFLDQKKAIAYLRATYKDNPGFSVLR